MIKDTMKRKKPSFDESYYGYRSFTHLLEEADNLALVDIERNPKSGTYVVSRFCGEREAKVAAARRRRRRVRPALPAPSIPLPAGIALAATGGRRRRRRSDEPESAAPVPDRPSPSWSVEYGAMPVRCV